MNGAQPLRSVQHLPGPQRLPVAAEQVAAVLLADGWHQVAMGSFTVGVLGFGDGDHCGVLGYRFEEISNGSLQHSATLAGPLDAVLAVRQAAPRPLQQQGTPGRGWAANRHARAPQHPPRQPN